MSENTPDKEPAVQADKTKSSAETETTADEKENKENSEQVIENPEDVKEEEYKIHPLAEGEKLTRAQRNVWEERANEIIEKIRPYIQHDGGDVELLGIDEDGIAYVTFLGACAGCMMAGEDFSTGVRLLLLDEFPELKEVVLVGA